MLENQHLNWGKNVAIGAIIHADFFPFRVCESIVCIQNRNVCRVDRNVLSIFVTDTIFVRMSFDCAFHQWIWSRYVQINCLDSHYNVTGILWLLYCFRRFEWRSIVGGNCRRWWLSQNPREKLLPPLFASKNSEYSQEVLQPFATLCIELQIFINVWVTNCLCLATMSLLGIQFHVKHLFNVFLLLDYEHKAPHIIRLRQNIWVNKSVKNICTVMEA